MKKSLVALAVLSALGCHAVNAQTTAQPAQTTTPSSNVTLYGLIDATIRTLNNATPTGGRLTGFQTPWFSGSRWGVTGKEDLGDGLNAIFRLESEFVVGTGAMDTPNVLFNRDAWVGVEGKSLGKLTFGRQNTLARDFAQIYGDAYGSSQLSTAEGGFTNTNNFKQLIYYAGSVTATRYDNGIVWKKVFDNGLVGGLGYQLGEVPGAFSKNTTRSAAIGYNGSHYVVSGFFTSANVNNLTHKSYSVGGSYLWDLLRLNAGWFHYTADQGALGALGQRKDNAYTVSVKVTPAGAMDYELGYVMFKADNAAFNTAGTSTLNPFADASAATAAGTGKKQTVYGSVFYHLSRRTEVYVAADYMKLTDGYRVASANGFKNQTELAVGMRTRF